MKRKILNDTCNTENSFDINLNSSENSSQIFLNSTKFAFFVSYKKEKKIHKMNSNLFHLPTNPNALTI